MSLVLRMFDHVSKNQKCVSEFMKQCTLAKGIRGWLAPACAPESGLLIKYGPDFIGRELIWLSSERHMRDFH